MRKNEHKRGGTIKSDGTREAFWQYTVVAYPKGVKAPPVAKCRFRSKTLADEILKVLKKDFDADFAV